MNNSEKIELKKLIKKLIKKYESSFQSLKNLINPYIKDVWHHVDGDIIEETTNWQEFTCPFCNDVLKSNDYKNIRFDIIIYHIKNCIMK